MKTPKQRIIHDDVYMPKAEFKEYLDKRLQHELSYQKKIDAGAKLSEKEERERNELHRMKNHWLNKCVFPSMANLTVFLEYIAKSEELRKVFDDDLKELFLGRKMDKISDGQGGERVFQRFIRSAITWNWSKKENANDFRLALIHIIEYALFQHLNSVGVYLLDSAAKYVVKQDSTRILAWAETLARNVDIEGVDDASRPVRF
jgi:hypothetical protein